MTGLLDYAMSKYATGKPKTDAYYQAYLGKTQQPAMTDQSGYDLAKGLDEWAAENVKNQAVGYYGPEDQSVYYDEEGNFNSEQYMQDYIAGLYDAIETSGTSGNYGNAQSVAQIQGWYSPAYASEEDYAKLDELMNLWNTGQFVQSDPSMSEDYVATSNDSVIEMAYGQSGNGYVAVYDASGNLQMIPEAVYNEWIANGAQYDSGGTTDYAEGMTSQELYDYVTNVLGYDINQWWDIYSGLFTF